MININVLRNIHRVKKIPRGTVTSGDTINANAGTLMFVILKGEVGVYTDYGQPDAEMIRTLGAGDLFADPGLLYDEQASYTTVTLCDAIIIPIRRKNICDFIKEEPDLVFELIRELCLRLEHMNTAYKALIVQHGAQRRGRSKLAAELESRPQTDQQI